MCKIETCLEKHYGKGYCKNHYQKFYRSKTGTINPVIRDYKKYTKCTIKNCSNKAHAKGFCGTHYTQYRKENKLYKQNNKLKENIHFEYKDRNNWSLSIKQIFSDECMICLWKEAPCDVHHILPHHKGGKNTIKNSIVLCPNHHKLADMEKISSNDLQEITNTKLKIIAGE